MAPTYFSSLPIIIIVTIVEHCILVFHPAPSLIASYIDTPVGINEKGFVNSNFGMFLLLDYCIENERGSVGMQLCRVLIKISFKSSKIVFIFHYLLHIWYSHLKNEIFPTNNNLQYDSESRPLELMKKVSWPQILECSFY